MIKSSFRDPSHHEATELSNYLVANGPVVLLSNFQVTGADAIFLDDKGSVVASMRDGKRRGPFG